MKKSYLSFCLVLGLVLCLGVAWPGVGYAGKKIQMNFVSVYMPRHNTVVNGFKPWLKLVEKESNGRVKMNHFDPDTLCPARETWNSTVAGSVDFGTSYCTYNPGRFFLTEVMELPLIVPGAEAGSLVAWEINNKYPELQAQFKDVKLLWQWTSATYQLHTAKKMVRTLDDLKGMKIIGWSPRIIKIIELLGASPIEITGNDSYLAMERGMADGVFCPLAPIRSMKISDAVKYHTIVDMMVGPFWGAMNKSLWESLPPEIQKVFLDTTGERMARICGQTLDQGAAEDSVWLKKQGGHDFYVLPDDERERWLEAVQNIHEEWVKKAEDRGFKNARAILNDAKALGKKYAKTTGRGYQE